MYALALLQMVGCGTDTPAGDGKMVTFDTVCNKAHEGAVVTLEGFLDFPSRFNAKAATIVMRLQAAPTRTSRFIGARVTLNAGTNTIIPPPDKYNESDLKALTHDGKPANYKTRVKVTGAMRFVDSLETREFQCVLTNTRVDLAGEAASK